MSQTQHWTPIGGQGLFGPANLPAPIVAKIRHDVEAYIRTPEVSKFYKARTIEPVSMTPDEFAKRIRDDYKHWGSLIDLVGVKHD